MIPCMYPAPGSEAEAKTDLADATELRAEVQEGAAGTTGKVAKTLTGVSTVMVDAAELRVAAAEKERYALETLADAVGKTGSEHDHAKTKEKGK